MENIHQDFPDLNENLLFSKVEDDLIVILNSLENKDFGMVKNNANLVLIRDKLQEEIQDRINQSVNEKFDNITFNGHGIRSYKKEKGKATIEISSSVGYMYATNQKKKRQYSDVKKQTRFTTKYIYVYDQSKLKDETYTMVFLHCPNCGAPLKSVNGNVTCEYCGSYVSPINLKEWKIVFYKNDYAD